MGQHAASFSQHPEIRTLFLKLHCWTKWLWAKFSSSFLSRLPAPSEVVLLRCQNQEERDWTSHQLWEWIQTSPSCCFFTLLCFFSICFPILVILLWSLLKGSFYFFINNLFKNLMHRICFLSHLSSNSVCMEQEWDTDVCLCTKQMYACRLRQGESLKLVFHTPLSVWNSQIPSESAVLFMPSPLSFKIFDYFILQCVIIFFATIYTYVNPQ